MAGPGLKLNPPDKYDGETDFERFSKLLNAHMGCQDNDYCDMLEVATRSPTPITLTEINEHGSYFRLPEEEKTASSND